MTSKALLIGLLLVTGCAANSLEMKKTDYFTGEPVEVEFKASKDLASDAWVGIIPAEVPHGNEAVNDQHDLAYQYISKRVFGIMTFMAPETPGAYDMRMHDTDSDGKELASVRFSVRVDPALVNLQPALNLNKRVFAPGETIVVGFTAPKSYAQDAWVGIIPAHVPHGDEAVNDEYDMAFDYLHKRTRGTLEFQAPEEPGAYDLRMHDTDLNGREVASVSFEVQVGS